MKTLYVSDVDVSIDENRLKELFSPYGNVVNSTIKKSSKGTNDFYYAFIEYDRPEDAEQALKEMDQHELAGKRLNVKFAKPKEGRSFAPRQFYNEFRPKREGQFDSFHTSPRARSGSRERSRRDDDLFAPGRDRIFERNSAERFPRDEIAPVRDRYETPRYGYRDRFDDHYERQRDKPFNLREGYRDEYFRQERFPRENDDRFPREDRFTVRDDYPHERPGYDRFNERPPPPMGRIPDRERPIDRMSDRDRPIDRMPSDRGDRIPMERMGNDRDYAPLERMREPQPPYRRDEGPRDGPYSRDRFDSNY